MVRGGLGWGCLSAKCSAWVCVALTEGPRLLQEGLFGGGGWQWSRVPWGWGLPWVRTRAQEWSGVRPPVEEWSGVRPPVEPGAKHKRAGGVPGDPQTDPGPSPGLIGGTLSS